MLFVIYGRKCLSESIPGQVHGRDGGQERRLLRHHASGTYVCTYVTMGMLHFTEVNVVITVSGSLCHFWQVGA
jgi:hypothetical protein